jgi:cell division protein FtsI/penicillin-binding protein 2
VLQPTLAGPQDFTPRERWRLPAGTRFDGLSEGFLAAVNEGSASPAFDPEVAVAGKTGTCSALGWFASYAPAERPQVVAVVFLKHGSGHGASIVAGKMFRELFANGATPAAAATSAGAP